MTGVATPAQIAAFGVSMKMKRPTPAEVTELADTMLGTRAGCRPTRSATRPSTWSAPEATAPTR